MRSREKGLGLCLHQNWCVLLASPHGSAHTEPSPQPSMVVLFVSLFVLCDHCWWYWTLGMAMLLYERKPSNGFVMGFSRLENMLRTEYEMVLDFFFFFLRKLDVFGFGGGNLKNRERKCWKKTKRERQMWERGKDIGV